MTWVSFNTVIASKSLHTRVRQLTILHDTGDFRIIVCFHAVLDIAVVIDLHLKPFVSFVTAARTRVHLKDGKRYTSFD